MNWIKREADDHNCNTPKYGESAEKPVAVGDEWVCDACGTVWVVTDVDFGDQRDPMPMGFIRRISRTDFPLR